RRHLPDLATTTGRSRGDGRRPVAHAAAGGHAGQPSSDHHYRGGAAWRRDAPPLHLPPGRQRDGRVGRGQTDQRTAPVGGAAAATVSPTAFRPLPTAL